MFFSNFSTLPLPDSSFHVSCLSFFFTFLSSPFSLLVHLYFAISFFPLVFSFSFLLFFSLDFYLPVWRLLFFFISSVSSLLLFLSPHLAHSLHFFILRCYFFLLFFILLPIKMNFFAVPSSLFPFCLHTPFQIPHFSFSYCLVSFILLSSLMSFYS